MREPKIRIRRDVGPWHVMEKCVCLPFVTHELCLFFGVWRLVFVVWLILVSFGGFVFVSIVSTLFWVHSYVDVPQPLHRPSQFQLAAWNGLVPVVFSLAREEITANGEVQLPLYVCA